MCLNEKTFGCLSGHHLKSTYNGIKWQDRGHRSIGKAGLLFKLEGAYRLTTRFQMGFINQKVEQWGAYYILIVSKLYFLLQYPSRQCSQCSFMMEKMGLGDTTLMHFLHPRLCRKNMVSHTVGVFKHHDVSCGIMPGIWHKRLNQTNLCFLGYLWQMRNFKATSRFCALGSC